MPRQKPLNVFFDIETLTVNRLDIPRKQKVCEYIVSYKYNDNGDIVEGVKPNLYEFIETLCKLKKKKIILFAHNGEGYDFHFLRRVLIDYYGLMVQNEYLKNSVNHDMEVKKKDLKHQYLLESHVRAKTRINLKFKVNGVEFETADTLPRFHASVRTIGGMLKDLGLDDNGKNVKLNYDDDYTKYDLDKDLSWSELRKYCLKVYNQLNKHALDYVMNDTRVIYQAYYNYNKIYAPTYDSSKRTLSLNILDQYKVNALASFQLINEVPDNEKHKRIELTDYLMLEIGGKYENMFQYIHHYYKGGLNMYNEKYIAKIVHNLVHLDLNSSYPTVMRYRIFPTFLKEAKVINGELNFDKNYYYFIQVSKIAFQRLYLSRIKSKVVREMFVKYFANPTDSVYLQTPHIKLLSMFLHEDIKSMPVISYLKYKAYAFGGLKTIQFNYAKKTQAKKRHASNGEVQAFKVPLNGIYGIPALRAYFPLFEYDDNLHEYVSIHDKEGNFGFKNKERNLTFACSVTAWAFLQLLTPLTHNVEGVDDAFIYADTDSLFLKRDYWEKIKPYVNIDHYDLGAWDEEHSHITDFYALNHKKYCLYSEDNKCVEVFAGGIPKQAFHADEYDNLKDFIKERFHNGMVVPNTRNQYTDDGVIVLYDAKTKIQKGGKYPDHFPRNAKELEHDELLQNVIRMLVAEAELEAPAGSSALYYETPLGSLSASEAFPPYYENNPATLAGVGSLIKIHSIIEMKIKKDTDLDKLEKTRKEKLKV